MGRLLLIGSLAVLPACTGGRVAFAPGETAIDAELWAQIAPAVVDTIDTFDRSFTPLPPPRPHDFYVARVQDEHHDELWLTVSGARCATFCFTFLFARTSDAWVLRDYLALGVGADGRPRLQFRHQDVVGLRLACSTDFCYRERGRNDYDRLILQHCTISARDCSEDPLRANPAYRPRPVAFRPGSELPAADRRAALAVLAVAVPTMSLAGDIDYALLDVSGDGVSELVVIVRHGPYCGTRGCMGYVLRRAADGFVIFGDAGTAHDAEVVLVQAKTSVGTVVDVDVGPAELGRTAEWNLIARWAARERPDWFLLGTTPLPKGFWFGTHDLDGDGAPEIVVATEEGAGLAAADRVPYEAWVLKRNGDELVQVGTAMARFTQYVLAAPAVP